MLTIQNYSNESLSRCQSVVGNLELSSNDALSIRVREDKFAEGLEIDPQEFSQFCSQLDGFIRSGENIPGRTINRLIDEELPNTSTRSKILLSKLIYDLEYRRRCIANPDALTLTPYKDKIGKDWNIVSHNSVGARSFKPIPQIKTYNCFPHALVFVENRSNNISHNDHELLDMIAEVAQEVFEPERYEKGLVPDLNSEFFQEVDDKEKISIMKNLTIDEFAEGFFNSGENGSDAEIINSNMRSAASNSTKRNSYWHLVNVFLRQFNAMYDRKKKEIVPIKDSEVMSLPDDYQIDDGSTDWDKLYIDAYDYLASFESDSLLSELFYNTYDRAALTSRRISAFGSKLSEKFEKKFPDKNKAYNFAIVIDIGDDFYIVNFGDLVCTSISDDHEDEKREKYDINRRLFYDNYCVDRLSLNHRNGEENIDPASSYYRYMVYKKQTHGILIASRNLLFKDKELDSFYNDAVRVYKKSMNGETRDKELVAKALEQADTDYEQGIVLISKVRENDSNGGGESKAAPTLPSPDLIPA